MLTGANRLCGSASLLTTAVLTAAVLCGLSACSDATTSGPSTAGTRTAAPSGCSGARGPAFTGFATAYDAPVATADQSSVATEVSAPTLSPVPAEQSRYRIASVHVSARVVQNGSYVVSPSSVLLVDPKGTVCPRPAKNPLTTAFALTTVDEWRGADGNIAFLVPADADLANYSVAYVADPAARTALAQWSRSGRAPRRVVTNSCDGPRGTYDRSKAVTARFGSTGSAVRGGVGSTVTATSPTARALPPSSTVPGSVQGIAVQIAVTARGAAA